MAREDLETGREFGTVRWFNDQRGFGFIERDDGDDLFFHATTIKPGDLPDAGDRVSFVPALVRERMAATKVRLENH
jgi:cold shock protein